jgi:D-2-hydroxyacid dehydrogenase (NADP+)
MSFLIIDQYAEQYRQRLSAAFPDRSFVAVPDAGVPGIDFGTVQGLFAFGPAFDDGIVRRLVNLQWIQFLSSGTDTLSRLPSLDPRVIVTSCHGIHGPAVSEMAMVHMLTLSHDVRRILKDQEQRRWNRVEQPLLLNKVVTILGTGVIAAELARRCKAMGSLVHGVSSTPRPLEGFDKMFSRAELATAAALTDFLVLLAPLSDQTRGIVDRNVLRGMKPSAYLINVARGEICDEGALLEALRDHTIAGAGLDAFAVEPLPPEHPFWAMENVIVTPHVAGQSTVYVDMALPVLLHNMTAFLAGHPHDMRNRVERATVKMREAP